MASVYAIINTQTGKMYIGSTDDFLHRKKQHIWRLNKGDHVCTHLQKDWNKNPDLFSFCRIVGGLKRQEAYDLEQDCINQHKPDLYNISFTVQGGNTLENHPDRKNLEAKRNKKFTKYIRSLTSEDRKRHNPQDGKNNVMYGRTHTDEVKKKLSEFHKGNSWALGCKRTPEHKAKLSEIASKRIGELNPFYGKQHTAKTKKKLSDKLKGRKPPNQRKVKIGKILYESVTEASRQIKVCPATVIYRINSSSEKFKSYEYADN